MIQDTFISVKNVKKKQQLGQLLNATCSGWQIKNKKAELSQRWPRDVPYMHGTPEDLLESLSTPTATFPEIFNGLSVPMDPVNVRTKFEVRSFSLPVPEIG